MESQAGFLIKFALGLGIFISAWVRSYGHTPLIYEEKKASDDTLVCQETTIHEDSGTNPDVHLFINCGGFL